ncbi:MAG: amidohydrolase [Rhodospirillaceae bacterium]|nr:amidohydrolase [Rhodospirillaceae bacterium]
MTALLTVTSAVTQPTAQTAIAPDVIYINGNVVTVDRRFSTAQAFAVKGDKFSAVGTVTVIRNLAAPSTRVIDLKGNTVVPGFIDAHAHTITRKRDEVERVPLHDVRSIDEIVQCILDAAEAAAPGAWIVTTYIGEMPDAFHVPESLAEKRWPTRAELDKAAPNNPVYIPGARKWPHPSIFNSRALALLGITRDTTEARRERIVKDDAGEPTGLVYGMDQFNDASSLRAKLAPLLPKVSAAAQIASVKEAILENIAAGVTTLYEAHNTLPAFVDYLNTLRNAGDLKNRVVFAYELPSEKSLPDLDLWMKDRKDAQGTGTGDDLLRILGVTVSMDGATQFGAAMMNKPYLDPNGKLANGESDVTPEKLLGIARLAVKNDLRLNIVAAGDKAIDTAVSMLEKVNRETPITDRRWVVQHVQHPSRTNIARLKALGVVATTYSSVDYSKGAAIYVDRFPGQDDVWKEVVPLRWWIDGGVTIAQSTDGAHYRPMFTLWESLVRIDGRTGKSLMAPAKEITRREALELFTINGARVLMSEDRIGSIESGKLADFVILEKDILTIPVDEIRDTEILMTALGGKAVYGAVP